jgi:hypothetical protein
VPISYLYLNTPACTSCLSRTCTSYLYLYLYLYMHMYLYLYLHLVPISYLNLGVPNCLSRTCTSYLYLYLVVVVPVRRTSYLYLVPVPVPVHVHIPRTCTCTCTSYLYMYLVPVPRRTCTSYLYLVTKHRLRNHKRTDNPKTHIQSDSTVVLVLYSDTLIPTAPTRGACQFQNRPIRENFRPKCRGGSG